ncbi:MAG: hypothetical protein EPO68_00395 [Planctomycetota bacterium]|nr:MAG: hypothetical protein EPO68_00395 [Planctomycetota bacterium]
MKKTMAVAVQNVAELAKDPVCGEKLSPRALSTWVADKGYHSNETMRLTAELGLTPYISEPDRGERRWKGEELARRGTYDNRRRIRGERGKRILRGRGELLERSFAHTLGTGGRRPSLRADAPRGPTTGPTTRACEPRRSSSGTRFVMRHRT